MELNIRLAVLVVETARLERRGVNDNSNIVFGELSERKGIISVC